MPEMQCTVCAGWKLLGMQKMVATFYCRRTHLDAIPVSRPEWQSESRMQHPFFAYPAVFIQRKPHIAPTLPVLASNIWLFLTRFMPNLAKFLPWSGYLYFLDLATLLTMSAFPVTPYHLSCRHHEWMPPLFRGSNWNMSSLVKRKPHTRFISRVHLSPSQCPLQRCDLFFVRCWMKFLRALA